MDSTTALDGQQVNTAPVASVNENGHENKQGLNTFNLDHYNALTCRFGDITPFLSMETAPRDVIRFSSNHELRTMTLKSPLLSPVRLHKSYFHVPFKAICPETWDIFIKNPKFGNDIPDNVEHKWNFYEIQYYLRDQISDYLNTLFHTKKISQFDVKAFKYLVILRNTFSKGSLLRLLGYPVLWEDVYNKSSFDNAFDSFLAEIFNSNNYDLESGAGVFRINNGSFTLDTRYPVPFVGEKSVSAFFNSFEGNVAIDFHNYSVDSDNDLFPQDVIDAWDIFNEKLTASALTPPSGLPDEVSSAWTLNPSKLIGYHLVCAQFFSNDNIDDIDTADMAYRNLRSLRYKGTSTLQDAFLLNGLRYRYDLSCKYLQPNFNGYSYALDFWLSLVSFSSSLKYGDYFNGARTRPLAVGDVQIDVNNDKVQAIDVTKNLAKQRFLNAVNKLPGTIAQYAKGIFGVTPTAMLPQPQFISRSVTFVGNPETVNTAETQGKITSQLHSVDGKFEFTASFADNGILYGFIHFDVIPCYGDVTDRCLSHTDRFSFFNPMLQNIGDQPINFNELNPEERVKPTFAYQQRYAEYKNIVNQCSGGFALPANESSPLALNTWLYMAKKPTAPIDSEFIRHHREDFDRFYGSFDGVSLANYVHFAVILNNQISANRAMQYVSTLL